MLYGDVIKLNVKFNKYECIFLGKFWDIYFILLKDGMGNGNVFSKLRFIKIVIILMIIGNFIFIWL